jgi:DNA-binding NtrC family response regulator
VRDQVRQFESTVVYKIIHEAHGDRRIAAQKLGIGLSSLYRKIEEFEAFGLSQDEGVQSNIENKHVA